MTRRQGIAVAVLVVALFAAGCGGAGEPGNLQELQRVRAGTIDIVLLSENASVRPGKDAFFMEFRAADGQPVDVGPVTASVSMPMAGMAPMMGGADIRSTSTPGRYAVALETSMVGDWRLALEWKGPAGAGSANLSIATQP